MENYTEYIEAYFAGSLGAEEKKEFETRINMDKSFAEEVAFYLSAKQVLKEELIKEKKDWFRQLADQNPDLEKQQTPVRKMWVYRVAAAASFIGIIFLAWYLFFQQPTSPTQMADGYIKVNFDTLPVKMGVQEDDLQRGFRLYNEGQYTSSLEQFETVVQKDSSNYSAKRYAGIVCLRLGNYDKALQYFQQLENNTSLYTNPGKFLHALTLMKRNQLGDKEQALQLLQEVVDNNLDENQTARQWLKKF